MSDRTTVVLRDQAIAAAKDLPGLIDNLAKADPALAQQLTAKSLIASKSFWGQIIGASLTVLVAKLGLGWDDATVGYVTLVIVMGLNVVLRLVTRQPISGILS